MPKLRDLAMKNYTLDLFEVIERHTLLSSLYLRQFFPHLSESNLLHHLEELAEQGYLTRPLSLNPPHVFNDYKVYGIGTKARAILGERKAYPVSGDNRHKLMCGSITATIELEATKAGLIYISQEEILNREDCKQKSIVFGKLVPDQLFGIEYAGNARFFAVEADRGTESMTRIAGKVQNYKGVITNQAYKNLGIDCLYPLFVTTHTDTTYNKVKRPENIVKEIQKAYPNGSKLFLVKGITGFNPYLRTPKLMPHIFTDPFLRTGEPFMLANSNRH